MSQVGDLGSGAGRGGGGGGSIRDAGGSFGRMEAAHEEEYFHKKVCEDNCVLRCSLFILLYYFFCCVDAFL